MNKIIITLAAIPLLFTSCIRCPELQPMQPEISDCGTESAFSCPDYEELTIRDYTGLDGCGLVVENSSGEILEVSNLYTYYPSAADGYVIWVQYVYETDWASFCMVGPGITITKACSGTPS